MVDVGVLFEDGWRDERVMRFREGDQDRKWRDLEYTGGMNGLD